MASALTLQKTHHFTDVSLSFSALLFCMPLESWQKASQGGAEGLSFGAAGMHELEMRGILLQACVCLRSSLEF